MKEIRDIRLCEQTAINLLVHAPARDLRFDFYSGTKNLYELLARLALEIEKTHVGALRELWGVHDAPSIRLLDSHPIFLLEEWIADRESVKDAHAKEFREAAPEAAKRVKMVRVHREGANVAHLLPDDASSRGGSRPTSRGGPGGSRPTSRGSKRRPGSRGERKRGSRPSSRQKGSRPSSRQKGSRPSSRGDGKGSKGGGGGGEGGGSRPTSRQRRRRERRERREKQEAEEKDRSAGDDEVVLVNAGTTWHQFIAELCTALQLNSVARIKNTITGKAVTSIEDVPRVRYNDAIDSPEILPLLGVGGVPKNVTVVADAAMEGDVSRILTVMMQQPSNAALTTQCCDALGELAGGRGTFNELCRQKIAFDGATSILLQTIHRYRSQTTSAGGADALALIAALRALAAGAFDPDIQRRLIAEGAIEITMQLLDFLPTKRAYIEARIQALSLLERMAQGNVDVQRKILGNGGVKKCCYVYERAPGFLRIGQSVMVLLSHLSQVHDQRDVVLDEDGDRVLVMIMRKFPGDRDCAYYGLSCVQNLTQRTARVQERLVAHNVLPCVLSALKIKDANTQWRASLALSELVVGNEDTQARHEIGDIVTRLVELLWGAEDEMVCRFGLGALANLAGTHAEFMAKVEPTPPDRFGNRVSTDVAGLVYEGKCGGIAAVLRVAERHNRNCFVQCEAAACLHGLAGGAGPFVHAALLEENCAGIVLRGVKRFVNSVGLHLSFVRLVHHLLCSDVDLDAGVQAIEEERERVKEEAEKLALAAMSAEGYVDSADTSPAASRPGSAVRSRPGSAHSRPGSRPLSAVTAASGASGASSHVSAAEKALANMALSSDKLASDREQRRRERRLKKAALAGDRAARKAMKGVRTHRQKLFDAVSDFTRNRGAAALVRAMELHPRRDVDDEEVALKVAQIMGELTKQERTNAGLFVKVKGLPHVFKACDNFHRNPELLASTFEFLALVASPYGGEAARHRQALIGFQGVRVAVDAVERFPSDGALYRHAVTLLARLALHEERARRQLMTLKAVGIFTAVALKRPEHRYQLRSEIPKAKELTATEKASRAALEAAGHRRRTEKEGVFEDGDTLKEATEPTPEEEGKIAVLKATLELFACMMMSWSGEDEALAIPKAWSETQTAVLEAGGGVCVEALVAIATRTRRRELALPAAQCVANLCQRNPTVTNKFVTGHDGINVALTLARRWGKADVEVARNAARALANVMNTSPSRGFASRNGAGDLLRGIKQAFRYQASVVKWVGRALEAMMGIE